MLSLQQIKVTKSKRLFWFVLLEEILKEILKEISKKFSEKFLKEILKEEIENEEAIKLNQPNPHEYANERRDKRTN